MKTILGALALITLAGIAQAQTKVGSGDQGIQGLLAATTRQIVPGNDVIVSLPDSNAGDRVLVTATEARSMEQSINSRAYCVIILKTRNYGSVDFEGGTNRICQVVGSPIYIKGSYKIIIQYSNSIAFYEKLENEELIVKLSRIQIPLNKDTPSADVSRDMTSESELEKQLYVTWLNKNTLNGPINNYLDPAKLERLISGDISLLREAVVSLPEEEVRFEFASESLIKVVASFRSTSSTHVHVLPGTYKIRWLYNGGGTFHITKGIVLK